MLIPFQVNSLDRDSIYARKIQITSKEELLVCLDSDFATFHLYDIKKQHRFATWKYKNDALVDPKVYTFEIDLHDNLILIGGDHSYSGDDKKRKGVSREPFLSLHKLQPSFECLHLQRISEFDKQIITMCKDEATGIICSADYGKNIMLIRITANDKIDFVQVLREVHTDYPFSMLIKENRLYTCSLSQKVTAIEFQTDP